jgi:hypothetical protein
MSCPHTNLFNVLRGIVITIMHHAATSANPGSNAQRHFRGNHAATRAAFARRIPTVNFSKVLAVPFAFVLGFHTKRAKASVRNALGETVILDHAAHVQILNTNHVKTLDQIGREFVQVIVSRVGNVLMDSSHLQSLRIPTARAFLTPRENPLRFGKALLVLSSVLRVVNPFAVGQGSETIDSKIDPNHQTSFRQRLNVFVQHQRHKVLTSLVLANRDRGWFGLERSGPFDFQPAQPCNLQTSSVRIPFERTARVFGALIVRFLLELRITGSFVKEVLETGLQVPQRLLCRYARDFVQPLRFRLFLELGQRGAGFDVTHSFAGLMVAVRTCPECPVVDEPASPERARQRLALLERGVNSKPVAQLHTETIPRVSHNRNLVLALNRKDVRSWASTPTALRNRSTVGGAIPLRSNDRSIPPHAPFL